MSQDDFGTIDPDVVSGTELATMLNEFRDSIYSMHSGTARPAYAVTGLMWRDTSVSPNRVYRYDGSSDVLLGYFDLTNHLFIPIVGGGVETLASATTTSLASVPGSHVDISGSATITSFGTGIIGQIKTCRLTGSAVITNNANILTPFGATITGASGDRFTAVYLGSSVWLIMSYFRASSDPVEAPGVIKAFGGFTTPTGYLLCDGSAVSRSTYAALFAALTLSQSCTVTNGSAVVTGLSSTSRMTPGMPVSGTNIPGGTTIKSVDSGSQVTLSANATGSGTITLVVAPHGVGNGTTTFNLPLGNGSALIGRDNMGSAAQNISQVSTTMTTSAGSATATVASAVGLFIGMFVTSSRVPFGITIAGISGTTITLSSGTGVTAGTSIATRFSPYKDAERPGARGGSIGHVQVATEMPSHTHTGTTNTTGAHTHTYVRESQTPAVRNDVTNVNVHRGDENANTSSNGDHFHTFTTDASGGGLAHNNTSPGLVVDWIIKT